MAEQIIKCPHCQQDLSLDEQYFGMELECPACQSTFIIQAETQSAPENNKLGSKIKNIAGVLKDKAAAAAANVNSNLDKMQAAEDDMEYQAMEQKIEHIKKGIPVRKLYFMLLAVLVALPLSLYGICAVIVGRADLESVFGLCVMGLVFLVILIIASLILSNCKSQIDKKTSVEQDCSPIDRKRKILATFFSNIVSANGLANKVETVAENIGGEIAETAGIIASIVSFFIRKKATANVVITNIYSIFNQVREYDLEHLETLDVLPRFGKNSNQLVAEPNTLYSPLISDGAKYKFNEEGDFIYSKEEVTKVYTFEDQLLIFTALWDYTTGELYNEQTEAFFFKDITDISTENNYDKVKITNWITPPPPEVKPFPVKKYCIITGICIIVWTIIVFIGCISKAQDVNFMAVAWELLGGVVFLGLFLWLFCHDIINLKKIFPRKVETIKRVRASETFTITSTSGRSTGMTILCDGWFEANNGNFEQRSDNEKIIHAIRKMIEEKKVSVNE
jgi:hypothetical protein